MFAFSGDPITLEKLEPIMRKALLSTSAEETEELHALTSTLVLSHVGNFTLMPTDILAIFDSAIDPFRILAHSQLEEFGRDSLYASWDPKAQLDACIQEARVLLHKVCVDYESEAYTGDYLPTTRGIGFNYLLSHIFAPLE